MIRKLVGRLGWAVLATAVAVPAFAQSAGSLRGTVVDSTGAVVPGVTVVLTSETTKFTQERVSDATGGFFFAAITPGRYSLKASLEGFKTYEAKGLRVAANDTLGVNVTLEVGGIGETVEVTAERAVIQTTTGAREGLITTDQIESLSIIGRNPTELLRILPGVVAPDQSQFEQVGIGTGFGGVGPGSFSINGARAENLGVTLDGANLRDIGNNSGMMNVPNNEFVAEVKVQTSNYAAEFGSATVSVQAITKAGSSEFHGSAYYYTRPYKLAANDRSRSYAGQERPKSKFNYPGFTLSGPVLIPGTSFNKNRDKMFFFFGWEWQKQDVDTGSQQAVVPTADMRNGNFATYLGGQNLDLGTTLNIPRGYPNAGQAVPNRDLTPYLDPTGVKLMGLYPAPNLSDPTNRYNYITTRLNNNDRKQGILRLDYNLSDSTRAYIRLAQDSESPERYRGLWWQPGAIELPTPLVQKAKGQSAVFNLTSVLSPTITNEFIFAWSRLKNDNTWKDESLMLKSTYGIDNLDNPYGSSPYVPELVNEFNGGRASIWFAQDVQDIFSYNGFLRFQDNLTKVLNTHALKFGVVVERQYKNQNFQHNANIQYNFAPWGNGSTGNDVADILVGRPAQAAIGQPSAIGNFIAWNLEAFAQDSWKVSKNFTLEYGLRFGKWTNNKETNNLGAVFDPAYYDRSQGIYLGSGSDLRLNGLAYTQFGDIGQGMIGSRPLLFMPRVNFAWDIKGDGDMIVRGGGGIFYVREQGNVQYNVINVPPNSFASTLDAGTLQNAFPGEGYNGYQGLDYQTTALGNPFSALNAPTIGTPNKDDLNWPRTYNASISVAKRLPWRNVLEVGYVGTWGRQLVGQWDVNYVPEGGLYSYSQDPLLLAGMDSNYYNTFRPYPTLGTVNLPVYIGVSDYKSLQATLSRQSGNFTYLVAYTLSQAKGTVANDFANLDPFPDWKTRDYGILPTDRTNILNVSWTWRLGAPFSGGIGKYLLNDWNLSGISTWSSGQPWRPFFEGDLGGDQAERAWYGTQDFRGGGGTGTPGGITPTYTCNPNLGGNPGVGEKLWDIGCVGIPGFGDSGPAYPPDTIRTPGRSFHDLTVFKDFPLGGARRLQLRFGVFNLFNQAYPDMINFQDIDFHLNTSCNVSVPDVPNGVGGTGTVCDPTAGYAFTDNTISNFGKVITKRGHRVIELAVRFFF
jgi:outer membrane receptor protein involved in Fe transport